MVKAVHAAQGGRQVLGMASPLCGSSHGRFFFALDLATQRRRNGVWAAPLKRATCVFGWQKEVGGDCGSDRLIGTHAAPEDRVLQVLCICTKCERFLPADR
jgi:hypothetical protein